ncbi:MAG TPA: nitrite/sulfite reductase [Granulicella sp.]
MASIVETPATPAPVKETKAQRAERLKAEKNPWEAWDEVLAFARNGHSSIRPEWINTYFRWWGLYTQGDGAGVTGGVGGEGKSTAYFMLRIALPNGIVSSEQLRTIGSLTRRYAHNIADITTRQNIQLHWITIQDVPEIVGELTRVGLSPKGACGDVIRNVTGCPLAGLDATELLDTSPLALQIAQELRNNSEFYNLPRKFKITVSGCAHWCSYPEINDIGFTAARRVQNGVEEIGYTVRVGGGLSNEPHIAVRLPAFVQRHQAFEVARSIVTLFKEQDELRENRTRARMKYLFLRHGWTAESFLVAVESRLGYRLDAYDLGEDRVPDDIYRDHAGVTQQKQPGLSTVGASVLRGRLTSEHLLALAELADRFGSGELRATIMQNILIVNVPNDRVPALIEEINDLGLQVNATPFWRGAIACTGTEFCKLAIAETKGFAKWLVEEMEGRLPGFDQQIKLHVTGCTNSCGQHWIADVGLEGKKIKKDGKMVDAFYFCVGGAVGAHAGTARQVGFRAAADEVPEALERMLRHYLAARQPGEDLRAYFARTDDATLREQLAGAVVTPVERDPAPAGGVRVGEE